MSQASASLTTASGQGRWHVPTEARVATGRRRRSFARRIWAAAVLGLALALLAPSAAYACTEGETSIEMAQLGNSVVVERRVLASGPTFWPPFGWRTVTTGDRAWGRWPSDEAARSLFLARTSETVPAAPLGWAMLCGPTIWLPGQRQVVALSFAGRNRSTPEAVRSAETIRVGDAAFRKGLTNAQAVYLGVAFPRTVAAPATVWDYAVANLLVWGPWIAAFALLRRWRQRRRRRGTARAESAEVTGANRGPEGI